MSAPRPRTATCQKPLQSSPCWLTQPKGHGLCVLALAQPQPRVPTAWPPAAGGLWLQAPSGWPVPRGRPEALGASWPGPSFCCSWAGGAGSALATGAASAGAYPWETRSLTWLEGLSRWEFPLASEAMLVVKGPVVVNGVCGRMGVGKRGKESSGRCHPALPRAAGNPHTTAPQRRAQVPRREDEWPGCVCQGQG